MKEKMLIAAVVAVTCLAYTSFAQHEAGKDENKNKEQKKEMRGGEGGHGGRMMGGGGGMGDGMITRMLTSPRMMEELGLTEEQTANIKAKMQALQEQETKLREALMAAGKEQAKLMMDATVDKATIMAAVEKTVKTHSEMAKLGVEKLFIVRESLTPEQLKKLTEKVQQFTERMKEHMQNREGGEGKGGPRGGAEGWERGKGLEKAKEAKKADGEAAPNWKDQE